MTERMSTFFPSEFTGIAQWIICTIYVLSNEKGIRGWKAVALILFALPILVLMNIAHSEQSALIWLVITVCCLESVLIYLRLGIREDFSLILLRWCNAVMQSEFAAALAYVINIYLVSRGVMRFPDIRASQTIMLFVYVIIFIPLGISIYHRSHRKNRPLKAGYVEVISSFMITIGAYLLSNISFLAPESIFGISMGGGILLVRVVSDFSGMLALIAINEFSYGMRLKMNMGVLQSLLDRQYEQYQQFKVNNEQMQQVYHDIKHLINYIRSVSDSQKYEKELRSVEQTVSNFETQYDTGNPVLDVVLSSKKMMCRSALITMECYMDAREMDFLDTAQICTIFGNALDNAIEYESRIEETEKRLIKVSVFSENHFLVIKISNYCEETILKSLEDPETTKENPEIHGYGIKGIRLAVEKYEGHMTIKQENNWFIVSILIPIPEKQNQTAL